MARIARSSQALYQTVGRERPVSWPITISTPSDSASGAPVDLTGATAEVALVYGETRKPLTVTFPSRVDGRILVSGASSIAVEMPVGRATELQVTLKDSLGAVTDYVWPVIGETL